MRGPRRVNSIGLSLIQIERVRESGFGFAGVDLLEGTPGARHQALRDPVRPPAKPSCEEPSVQDPAPSQSHIGRERV